MLKTTNNNNKNICVICFIFHVKRSENKRKCANNDDDKWNEKSFKRQINHELKRCTMKMFEPFTAFFIKFFLSISKCCPGNDIEFVIILCLAFI